MLKDIALAFIPVFVAVDALGILPIFVSLNRNLERKKKKKIIVQSMITALCLAIGFIFLGKGIFKVLGIHMADFMVAGGLILFCIAILDILVPGKQRRVPLEEIGIVPLGTPLIAGPAVLTTALIIIPEYGVFVTMIAVIMNILLVGIMFLTCDFIIRIIGEAGTKALSKIASLFLAAIAVMMIRRGISTILTQIPLG